jgi:hypothetical protein
MHAGYFSLPDETHRFISKCFESEDQVTCGAALDAVPNLMVEYINKGFFTGGEGPNL